MGNSLSITNEWKWVPLKEISHSIQYGYTESSSKERIGPKFLRITDIQDNNVIWDDVPYCRIDDDSKDKYLLKDGDLVFARTGATVGKSFLIKGEIPEAVFASYLIRVRAKDAVDHGYLYNFFQSSAYWRQITEGQVGIGQPNVNGTKLGQLLLPVPPKRTQQAIVSKIEELFSELNKGIENFRLAQQQLKTYRQSVLKWAFQGKLTNAIEDVPRIAFEPHSKVSKEREGFEEMLPKGWKLTPLGNHIEKIVAGKSYRCQERPPLYDELGIIKVSAVTWGTFNEQESKTCFSNESYNPNYIINKEDFLFSRANTLDLIGACVIVKSISKHLMLSDKILRFSFTNNVLPAYILHYLRSKSGRKQIETLSTGNQESMRNIGQEKIKQIQIPFCSLGQQKIIVEQIENRFSVADKLEESINQSLQQAEALRQSILKKAFEGMLLK